MVRAARELESGMRREGLEPGGVICQFDRPPRRVAMTLEFKDMHHATLYRHFRRQALEHGWTLLHQTGEPTTNSARRDPKWSFRAVRGTEQLVIHCGTLAHHGLQVRAVVEHLKSDEIPEPAAAE